MLGEKIIKLREANSLSQRQLAKKVGISNTAIKTIEENKNSPSVNTVLSIAKYFNVSFEYLLDYHLDSSKEVPNIALSKEEMKNYVKQLREIADKLEASFDE
jgi:transcriptional regulator with XRE-family HTH domain